MQARFKPIGIAAMLFLAVVPTFADKVTLVFQTVKPRLAWVAPVTGSVTPDPNHIFSVNGTSVEIDKPDSSKGVFRYCILDQATNNMAEITAANDSDKVVVGDASFSLIGKAEFYFPNDGEAVITDANGTKTFAIDDSKHLTLYGVNPGSVTVKFTPTNGVPITDTVNIDLNRSTPDVVVHVTGDIRSSIPLPARILVGVAIIAALAFRVFRIARFSARNNKKNSDLS